MQGQSAAQFYPLPPGKSWPRQIFSQPVGTVDAFVCELWSSRPLLLHLLALLAVPGSLLPELRAWQLILSHQSLRHTSTSSQEFSPYSGTLLTLEVTEAHFLGQWRLFLYPQQGSVKKSLLGKFSGCSYVRSGGGWWAKGFREGFGHYLVPLLIFPVLLLRIFKYLLFYCLEL